MTAPVQRFTTLVDAERAIRADLSHAAGVLLDIKRLKLYRDIKGMTWDRYCTERLGQSVAATDRQIKQWRAWKALGSPTTPIGTPALPAQERPARIPRIPRETPAQEARAVVRNPPSALPESVPPKGSKLTLAEALAEPEQHTLDKLLSMSPFAVAKSAPYDVGARRARALADWLAKFRSSLGSAPAAREQATPVRLVTPIPKAARK